MSHHPHTIVLLGRGALARDVARQLAAQGGDRRVLTISTTADAAPGEPFVDPSDVGSSRALAEHLASGNIQMLVVLALSESPVTPSQPWLHDRAVTDMVVSAIGRCSELGSKPPPLIVLSSTAVYGVAAASPLLFHERSACIAVSERSACERWAQGLRAAEEELRSLQESHRIRVGVLRAAPTLGGPLDSTLEALLRSRFPVRVLGYDPPVQPLAYEDLVQAVVLAIEQGSAEVLNIVGRSVVPLSRLLAMAGVYAPPLPGAVADRIAPAAMDGARLRWRTVADGRRAMQALGYRPERSLEEALRARR